LLREALKEKPLFPSGDRFEPSRMDFVAAAAIVEKITGASFEDLLFERVVRRLQLTTAEFGSQGLPGSEAEPLPHMISHGRLVSIEPGEQADIPPAFNPAGRLHMTLEDWAKFVGVLLGLPSAPKLLSDTMLKSIQTYDWTYSWGSHHAKRSWAKDKVMYVAGTNGRNYALGWIAPEIDFAILIACNAPTAFEALRECYKRIMAIYMPHVTVFKED
jgi:CubicO group peptidase (beta-lactamase class C family)